MKNILKMEEGTIIDHKFEKLMGLYHRIENLNQINNNQITDLELKVEKYARRKHARSQGIP